MKRRYVVLGLSIVFAIALAVPAFGGPGNPVATAAKSAKSIAKQALNKAKAAQKTANKALTTATTAENTATTAQNTATTAQAAATAANNNANTRIKTSNLVDGSGSASNATTDKSDTATCASGDIVLGGGYFISGTANQVTPIESSKEIYANGWFAEGEAISGFTPTWKITATAMCGSTS